MEKILIRLFPKAPSRVLRPLASLHTLLSSFNRYTMFLAQMAHETDGFRSLLEYTPDHIAEQKYGFTTSTGRILGNTWPGDGAAYKGRGYIQLTGRWNYANMSSKLGYDLVNHPELAEDPDIALEIALQYWRDRGCSELADKGYFKAITQKINGGLNGYMSRRRYLKQIQQEVISISLFSPSGSS